MNEKEKLIKISDLTGYKFVEVKGGHAYCIISGIEITNIRRPKRPYEDGFYRVIEATCEGICSVGSPSQKCIDKGLYSPEKCAVYYLDKAGNGLMNIWQCLKLMT